jgi:hypothetical protein
MGGGSQDLHRTGPRTPRAAVHRLGLAPSKPVGGVFWKTPEVVAWADGRLFAWLDDEFTNADQAWVAAHHPAPALLRSINPNCGLLPADFAALTTWASELNS